MSWILALLLGILVILAITAATGYFVAQEFAYMAVDRSRLSARAAAGDRSAERALGITRRTSFMLSGAQLGITVTGLLVGYVAEPLVGASVGEALGGVGVPPGVGIAIGTVLALLLSTLIQMVFGELLPKNLAIARPEPLALGLARSTALYLGAFGWLIRVFDAASNALLRVLRIEPVHDVEHSATPRDLEHIVEESRASGDLGEEESLLLDRILDFPRQDVTHAMVPRTRTAVVDADLDLAGLRALLRGGHSRYPVLADGDVVGVVDLIDVLTTDLPETAAVRELLRPALHLPATLPLPDAVRALREARAELACVVDEYGGFAGILTLEDLGEELTGDIVDEHDHRAEVIVPAGEGEWTAPGDLPLDEVERAVRHDLAESGAATIGGLLVELRGAFPAVGEVVRVPLRPDPERLALPDPPAEPVLEVEVLRIERHVPAQVRIRLTSSPEEAR
ncbi:hemolysin family protein [Brachybacterium hainanense]|uniref:Hemolysin family protein n=1 Tax=Brachybacterium hainanense TaxID=1541174 RepID=A0ABV6RGD7_9MICO